MAAKPVVLPEPFNGETSWEDWKLHFEDVAVVNEWTAEQKLKWLRVRLTGRAQRAFHRLPEESQASYTAAASALQQRFEPKSRMTRYQAEFETRRKKRTEGWADFGEDLRSLADRAFPDLQPEARECLALQSYLKQLDQPQVAFSIRQTRPRTLDEAVAATLEMESYAGSRAAGTIATLQEERSVEEGSSASGSTAAVVAVSPDPTANLTALMEKLMERVATLERQQSTQPAKEVKPGQSSAGRSGGRRRRGIVCWNCQQPGHLARNCRGTQQGN